MISYDREPQLGSDEFIDILNRSGLGERRPVGDAARISQMLEKASLIYTARTEDGKLVGVARCLSDDAYVCYVSDLAVCRSVQGQGVGKRILSELRRLIHPSARLFLLSAPAAIGFYERLGLGRHPDCFDIPADFQTS